MSRFLLSKSIYCHTVIGKRTYLPYLHTLVKLNAEKSTLMHNGRFFSRQHTTSNTRTALMKSSVAGVPQIPCRFFSTSPKNLCQRDNDNEGRPKKGFVVYVPGPLEWLLNKWNVFLINSKFDPSFRVEEFISGAKQALCVICRNVSNDDYYSLEGLMTETAVEEVQDLVVDWDLDEKRRLEFDTQSILLARPRKIRVEQIQGEDGVEIDIFFVVYCKLQGQPMMMEFGMELQRKFEESSANDGWITSGVNQLRFKKLG